MSAGWPVLILTRWYVWPRFLLDISLVQVQPLSIYFPEPACPMNAANRCRNHDSLLFSMWPSRQVLLFFLFFGLFLPLERLETSQNLAGMSQEVNTKWENWITSKNSRKPVYLYSTNPKQKAMRGLIGKNNLFFPIRLYSHPDVNGLVRLRLLLFWTFTILIRQLKIQLSFFFFLSVIYSVYFKHVFPIITSKMTWDTVCHVLTN